MSLGDNFEITKAVKEDIPAIVELLADDKLGKNRENYQKKNITQNYYQAFDEIQRDSNNELLVMKDKTKNNLVIATMQLTFIPNMTFAGGKRAQIEAVRVKESYRGQGLGKEFIEWAIKRAKAKGCRWVQLTTNKQRPEALEFYKKIGFVDSHIGLKFDLLNDSRSI